MIEKIFEAKACNREIESVAIKNLFGVNLEMRIRDSIIA